MTSKSVDRIAPGSRRDVDDVHQHLGALEMRQELRAEAVPEVRALDQSRHVRHDEAAVVAEVDDAEIGRQRRERVVGDLRPRRGDARDRACSCRRSETRRGRRRPAASAAAAASAVSPGRPGSARRGARLVEVANAALPRPPRPPRATSTFSPSTVRSASGISSSLPKSYATVPGGTSSTRSSPSLPVQFDPSPCPPRSALNSGWNR